MKPLVHGAAVRVIVEIEIAQRLPIGVVDDEALLELINRPRRREAALCHRLYRLRPQSSSASRRTAGAAGFLIFSQW
jgi:hypothetical protein